MAREAEVVEEEDTAAWAATVETSLDGTDKSGAAAVLSVGLHHRAAHQAWASYGPGHVRTAEQSMLLCSCNGP
jgi:hypothetical protein